MSAPVWFVITVAAFGAGRWLRLLWDWYADIHAARVQRTIDVLDPTPSWSPPSESERIERLLTGLEREGEILRRRRREQSW
jgi:hypothetical protein